MSNQVNLIPHASEFQTMKEMAQIAVKSGMIPSSIRSNEAAFIIMLKGRELGIPAMQAFSHIHVINGKPTMSAELMLTQIYKCIPKVSINYIQSDGLACIIECQRPHSNKTRWSFTIDEAKKAELLNKGPWKQYPAAMLRARAISIMARAQFPDCLNGVSYTPEELGADIDIDDQGNEIIKDVSPKENPKTISFETTNNQKPVDKQVSQPTQVDKPITENKEEKPKLKNEAPISMAEGKRINDLIEVKKILTADIKSTVEQLWGLQDHKLMKIWQAEVIIEILVKSVDRDSYGKNVMMYQASQPRDAKK